MLLALGILGKRVGSLVDGRMWATFAKSTIASLLMGISAYYTASFLESYLSMTSKLGQLLQTFAAIGVGVAVYLVLSFVLKMEETDFVLGLVRNKLKARG